MNHHHHQQQGHDGIIQSVAMFGSELLWKRDHVRGAMDEENNLGAISMESGLRAATAQLENRQRRFGLRLVSLPQGDQAREIVGAPTAIGRRFTNTLAYAGTTESTVLLEETEALDAELLQEDGAEAKAEVEKDRPGLTMFTDGSRLDSGAAGYSVVWKWGPDLGGHRNSHRLQPGGVRCRARRSRKGAGIGFPEADNAGAGHGLYRCSSRYRTVGFGGAWPRPAVCTPGKKTHRCTATCQVSSLKSDGARRAQGWRATRRRTIGRKLRRKSQIPVGRNG